MSTAVADFAGIAEDVAEQLTDTNAAALYLIAAASFGRQQSATQHTKCIIRTIWIRSMSDCCACKQVRAGAHQPGCGALPVWRPPHAAPGADQHLQEPGCLAVHAAAWRHVWGSQREGVPADTPLGKCAAAAGALAGRLARWLFAGSMQLEIWALKLR